MPWVGLQCVIMVFPAHTHLNFAFQHLITMSLLHFLFFNALMKDLVDRIVLIASKKDHTNKSLFDRVFFRLRYHTGKKFHKQSCVYEGWKKLPKI